MHRKAAADQHGFSFMAIEEKPKDSEKTIKKRCEGPRCKRISDDGLVWDISEFSKTKSGIQHVCKLCAKEIRILAQYNMTEKDCDKLLAKQNCLCAICNITDLRQHDFMPDLDFKSQKPKGLICNDCYQVWRHFPWILEHPEWVEKAMNYLQGVG